MSPELRLLLLSLVACLLMALAAAIVYRVRVTPKERERRRRAMLNRIGRMKDGMITDVGDETLYYTYTVMGVEYQTSQDIAALGEWMPADPNSLIGPATLKYAPRNPANSIVLCEEWSGLRPRSVAPGPEAQLTPEQSS